MDEYMVASSRKRIIEDILSNSLILHQLAPYIPITSLLALGGASKSIRSILYTTPAVFRYLNLSNVKSAQFELAGIDCGGQIWRNIQLDEHVTEDE
jgi:ABC-type proline/glycine betaine transport system permease subunit